MTSLRFGAGAIEPIHPSFPGHIRLKRRSSAPELADLNILYQNTEQSYEVGNHIRIQLQGGSTGKESYHVTAHIIKVFTPFTMAQVMVVRIFEPTLDLEGDFVLKVYNRRFTDWLREYYKVERWNLTNDIKYEKRRWSKRLVSFFYTVMADDSLFAGDDGEEDTDGSDGNEMNEQDEGDANGEAFYQAVCLKMYRAELEVYGQARDHGLDGTDVPRFISSIRIPPSYHSKHCHSQSANIKGVPGILIQYLPGFPLEGLYKMASPPPPRSAWHGIVDDGVRIVQYMNQKMDFVNRDCDVCNTVVHWDPIAQKWKCKIIDFGNCVIRRKDTRDWKWRELQALADEEDQIGQCMECGLNRFKDAGYVWKRSQYYDDLQRDFNRDLWRTGDTN